jgi:aminoglycoside phosphotransferase (APT) family kinase protein
MIHPIIIPPAGIDADDSLFSGGYVSNALPDELTREYSKRLGVLSGEQIQAVLTRFELGKLLAARPAPGGLFGQNVLVTSTAGEYVLRGHAHYDGQFEKERFFCRAIHERTRAQAPWPFLIEKSPEIFGWSYALMPLLPGVHLSDPEVRRSLTPDDRLGIARAMGEYLPLIQHATWDAPAAYDHAGDDLAPLGSPYAEWFAARTREYLARCRRTSQQTTTDGDVAWVESLIDAARASLDAPFAPVLVHTDYAEGNVVAERGADGWRIGGVFDLGEAYIGDGEYDLARLASAYGRQSPAMLQAFCGPYATARPPRPGFGERLALYIVADRLIFWEYGHRNKVWFTGPEDTSFRWWAEPFVALAATVAQL